MRQILIAPLILTLGLPVKAGLEIEPISHQNCDFITFDNGCLSIEWGLIQNVATIDAKSKKSKHIKIGLNKLIKTKEYSEAINQFNKFISNNKEDDKAYNYRGLAKFLNKDFKGAIDDYNKSITINKDNHLAYYNLGNLAYTLGHTYLRVNAFREASEQYTKAIDVLKYNKEYRGKDVIAVYYLARGLAKYNLYTDKEDTCKDMKKANDLGSVNIKNESSEFMKFRC